MKYGTYMALANARACLSHKLNTKVGAILIDENNSVVAEACNDYVEPFFYLPDFYTDVDSSLYSEHAERNVIFSAIRSGICDFSNKTLVVTHFPCCDCARAIILVGIKRIVVGNNHLHSDFFRKWSTNIKASKSMLDANCIEIIYE